MMRTTRLVLALALAGVAGAAHAGDAARGEHKFADCAACHATTAGSGADNVGPNLHGVFERKAGTLGDFRYSPAMKRSGITWTAQALDAFLADPQKAVPANRIGAKVYSLAQLKTMQEVFSLAGFILVAWALFGVKPGVSQLAGFALILAGAALVFKSPLG